MADLARIKRNVAKMAGLNAPEADIDGYIASEGVSVDDVRNFKQAPAAPKGLSERLAGQEPSSNVEWAPTRPDAESATAATINGLVSAVPGLQQTTDALMGAGGMLMGKDYGTTVRDLKNRRLEIARAAPVAKTLGQLAPIVVGAAAAPELTGLVGTLPKRLLNSTLFSAGYEGTKGLAEGDRGTAALKDIGVGAAAGAAGAAAGEGLAQVGGAAAKTLTNIMQKKVTSAAIKGAPSARDLANTSRQMFKAADNAGVSVSPDKFVKLVGDLAQSAKVDHINETLDPKAFATFGHLINIAKSALDGSRPLTLSDLHTIRQIAQKAAVSTEGRDSMFANRIVDGIDEFMTKGDGLVGGNADDLMNGISTWARSKRTGLLEEAIYKAQNQASGVENGLRTQFRAILQDPKKRKLFSDVELQAIKQVANGTSLSNATRLLGMFGFDLGSGRNALGGTVGAVLGGLPMIVAGTAARKGAEKLATNGAERAAKIVATPGIKSLPQLPNPLLPFRKPLEIMVRGGVPALASGNR